MRFISKQPWIVAAILLFVVVAQMHVWADLDPCLWKPNTTHRGTEHHSCQGCAAAAYATLSSAPGVDFTMLAARLEIQAPLTLQQNHRFEISSPRAPPR